MPRTAEGGKAAATSNDRNMQYKPTVVLTSTAGYVRLSTSCVHRVRFDYDRRQAGFGTTLRAFRLFALL
jgi:hypothetical protein